MSVKTVGLNRLYTVDEVAAILFLSTQQVGDLIASGNLNNNGGPTVSQYKISGRSIRALVCSSDLYRDLAPYVDQMYWFE